GQEYQVRLVIPDLAAKDDPVFARSGARDAEVVDLGARQQGLQQRQVVAGERHGRAHGERVSEGGNAKDSGRLLLHKVASGIAELIAMQTAAIIMAGDEPVRVQGVAEDERSAV